MGRAARIAGWTAGIIVLLILVLLGAVILAGNTTGGRHLIERLTPSLTHGRVRIDGLGGSFPASIEIGRLSLSDARGVWLTAEQVSLDWMPIDLLIADLHVESLQIARIDAARRPVPQPAPAARRNKRGSALPRIRIDLDRLSIGALVLEPPLAGTRASLAVQGSAHLRSSGVVSASLAARRTNGAGDYSLDLRLDASHVDATLEAREPASGPLEHLVNLPGLGALQVDARIRGPRHAERIEVTGKAGDSQLSVHGTLDLEDGSALLAYSLESPQTAPRPGLAWQHATLEGTWQGPLGKANAAARLRIDGLALPDGARLAALAADLNVASGDAKVKATASGLVLPGRARSLLADSPVHLQGTIRLDERGRPVQITLAQRRMSLQIQAVTAGSRSARFELRIPDLAPFAGLAGQRLSGALAAHGILTESGAGARLELDATSDLSGKPLVEHLLGESARLHLAAQWSGQTIEVEQLSITGRALSLAASGSARRASGGAAALGLQSLEARWKLGLAPLAALSPALAGTLDVSGTVSGPIDSLAVRTEATATLTVRGAPQGTLEAHLDARGLPARLTASLDARGRFAGAPLAISASLDRGRDHRFHLVIARAQWRSLQASGDVATGTNLSAGSGHLSFSIVRLADLQPILGRPLEGSVTGTISLSPDAGHTRAALRLDARNAGIPGELANVELSGAGPIDALPLRLTLKSQGLHGAPASLTAAAQLDAPGRSVLLDTLQVRYRGTALRLLAPARIAFASGLSIDRLSLGLQDARLELRGAIAPKLDLHASLSHVDAALIDSFAPHLLAQGTLAATAELRGTLAAPSGEASLQVDGLRMDNPAARGLPAIDLRGTMRLAGTSAELQARLSAGRASHIELTGRAPLSRTGNLDLKLSGALDAALANAFLEAHGERAAGALTVNATVTGPAQAPLIGGSLELAHGDLRDYAEGLHLSDVTARITGGRGELRIASFTGRAGPGSVSMTGTLGLLEPKLPIDVEITAKNAQPITNDILTANLDAGLRVRGTLRQRIDVSGTISVNQAQIGIPNGFPPNVAVLDVRRPGETPRPKPARPLIVGLDVTLSAPRQILVQGRGLDAELGGKLTLGGTAAAPQVHGGFRMIMGTFTLASTQLQFTQGRVSFNGAGLKGKIDPSLDFTAQAVVANATVNLHVSGFADAPKFTLSSTPSLPQDEILARLLFGKSASQLSALEVAEIGAALASLSGVGGGGALNPLAKLQKALGLNRLTVGSTTKTSPSGTPENSGASITAGRYVSSRVFVAATQNTTGTSQLRVDVLLSKHLKLQTRLGNGSATAQGTTPENDPGSSLGLSYQFNY